MLVDGVGAMFGGAGAIADAGMAVGCRLSCRRHVWWTVYRDGRALAQVPATMNTTGRVGGSVVKGTSLAHRFPGRRGREAASSNAGGLKLYQAFMK